MIKPEPLKKGDKIGIVAPARKVSREEMMPGIDRIRNRGYVPIESPNLYNAYNQYSGTDEQRLEDLMQMLDDAEIKAIFCARGGYGSMRLLDHIDLMGLMENPKWFIGFSDMTAIHNQLNHSAGIQSIHAPMLINMTDEQFSEESFLQLFSFLEGERIEYEFEPSESDKALNYTGIGKGILCGGNLSVLAALIGTNHDIDTVGKILFIEDLDEYLYHIDRMMVQLKKAYKFHHLSGMIVGAMSDMKDNSIPFGKSAYEIIHEHVAEFDFPVCFNFPAGHIKNNMPLILGAEAILGVEEKVKLQFVEAE
ncbi:MAG TPA: LD-carboxypeptidase [Bacteroidia bacterium]|nr:LD-carboxypeptidase [Bacteroidia bacterium]HNT79417.1 LD-carboxypeptidase [Bacteroidia bacterium]